jgi:flavorubredoxin
MMRTGIAEIADGIFRLSTFVPEAAAPAGLTFNQFLVFADQPLLFHAGPRRLFHQHRAALTRLIRLERLRWVASSGEDDDECGATDAWLAVASNAQPAQGTVARKAGRSPLLQHGATIDLGGRRVRYLQTPITGVLYDDSTRTLLCNQLFTQLGNGPALTAHDIVEPAIAAEDVLPSSPTHADLGAAIRGLAALGPRTLAPRHGPAFTGDCSAALSALAEHYDGRLRDLTIWHRAAA